ncbi:hypothetical protein SANTM175S_05794 [Streptomyces antimycoticus]
MPKSAPSGSAAQATRPLPNSSGPTATVPPRSWTREATSSALSAAKYVVQMTGRVTPADGDEAPMPTVGTPPSVYAMV